MTIIFGTTLRPDSYPLAEVAGRLAERLKQPLRVVHVAEDPRAPIVLGTDEEHILGSVREELEREAARIRTATGAEVRPHLAAGPVVDALVSIAEWELAMALVVGATSQARRRPLGGVAERVTRKSPVPVLTLRDPRRLGEWLSGQRPLKVLVGADLGQTATAARDFAARLRSAGPCELEVALVASPEETHARLGLPPPSDDHALSSEAETILRRELSRAAPGEEGPAALRVVSGRGSADVHLVARSDEGWFDLIVVGQRRRSVIEELWYGSVASGVLSAAPISVACVPLPLGARGPAGRRQAAPPKVVVVGTDLTEAGAEALEQASALVGPNGRIHVAHVVPISAPSERRALHDRAWGALSRLTTRERAASLERHVLEGEPAEQLCALALRVGADLIVAGARKRPATSRALLGSVALALVEASHVPVLLVPAPEL